MTEPFHFTLLDESSMEVNVGVDDGEVMLTVEPDIGNARRLEDVTAVAHLEPREAVALARELLNAAVRAEMTPMTRCARCNRTVRNSADNDQWFALSLTTRVCPECQTPEEREVITEVQLAYHVLDRGGTVFLPEGTIVGRQEG